jgi:Ala-tRNA(Pro) deacylase
MRCVAAAMAWLCLNLARLTSTFGTFFDRRRGPDDAKMASLRQSAGFARAIGWPTGSGVPFSMPNMPKTPDDLFAFLDQRAIVHNTVRHDPVFTVAEAQALRGSIAGGHSKNLLVKDRKDRLFLIVAEEDARLDLKTLHEKIGGNGKVSFASADLLRAHWGVEPGSVTPFGAINDPQKTVTVVLDRRMMRHDILNFHPLQNTMTTSIAKADLVRFLEAADHPPMIADVTVPPEA